MRSEAEILKRVQLEASKLGLTVFRNHTAAIEDKNGRWHRMGLCKGSTDLIGWHNETGRFVAIEVKSPKGRLSPEQRNFLDRVNQAGGISVVCDDEKKLKELLDTLIY